MTFSAEAMAKSFQRRELSRKYLSLSSFPRAAWERSMGRAASASIYSAFQPVDHNSRPSAWNETKL